MKRIVALLICILMLFCCQVNVFAESYSETETSEFVSPTTEPMPTEPSIEQVHPQYQNINNISLTFYVANGRACATYAISSKKNGVTVSVKIEKRTLGFIWVDIGDSKQEKTDKKYLSGSYSVSVDDSGFYRVVVEVKVNGEKASKTVTFDYDKNILMGDANSDGVVRANDARLILRFSAKLQKYNSNQKNICDIDKNGAVTAADARIALRMSARL